MKDIFAIKTDIQGSLFILNRQTGKWVIANGIDSTVKRKISTPFSNQPFTGVCMIALNMGRACNFDCLYCHIGDLKNESHSLSQDIGFKVLERMTELDTEDKHLVFHGSEPMLNYSVIKQLVVSAKKHNMPITFSIQSNGSLFDQQNLHFLSTNGVGIGISCDGLAIHQNTNRPYADGSPTYNDVVKNMFTVKDMQYGISIITVVTNNNVNDLVEIAESFERHGFDSVLFCPVNSVSDSLTVPRQQDLIYNLQKVCDRYLKKRFKGEKTIKVKNFRNLLGVIFMPKISSNCVQCGGGPKHPLLAIDVDGSLYPCDYFWGRVQYKIGNVFDMPLKDAISTEENFRCYREVDKIESCRLCNWKRFCGGGCPGGSVVYGRGIEDRSFYCEYNKAMLSYAAKKIPLIHSKRLLPDFLEWSNQIS